VKLLFEFLPIVLFFAAYQIWGIETATAVAIVASILQIALLKLRRLPVSGMQWFSLGIIVVFGGLTLWLHDPWFIKLKPTVLNLGFALVLLIAQLGFRKNLIQSLMGEQVRMESQRWNQLLWAWSGFFVVMAAVNWWVATRFSEAIWVQFKLFGFLGLFFLFAIAQGLWISRHGSMIEEGDKELGHGP
jgi:intracellular septation protein